jgi:lipopolysaccharide export system permease protein
MGSIGRYIFRTTIGAFLLVVLSLTAIIWVTQALREVDLMTSKGQTILVFLGITSLAVPLLILVIAPIALMIAVTYVLNKLSSDSELIVINASGASPWTIFRPFLAVAGLISLLVAALAAYVVPFCIKTVHTWAAEVRADLVTNIVQPGRFSTFERGLTFHIRERRGDGLLLGIFIDDRRNPKERASFLAEQGSILTNERGTFLVLENGSIQRQEEGDREPAIVHYDRYAFDLSQFSTAQQSGRSSVRERILPELLWPDPGDPVFKEQPGHFRAELNDRALAVLYPIVFVIVTFAYLGAPRTTRQSRALSIAATVGAISALRLLGFVSVVLSVNYPLATLFQYLLMGAAAAAGLYAISRGIIIETPQFISAAIAGLSERIARRPATT